MKGILRIVKKEKDEFRDHFILKLSLMEQHLSFSAVFLSLPEVDQMNWSSLSSSKLSGRNN